MSEENALRRYNIEAISRKPWSFALYIEEKLGEKITEIGKKIGDIRKDFGTYAYLILAPLLFLVLKGVTARDWDDHYYAYYHGYESFESMWSGIICFFIFCSATYFYFSIWLRNRVEGFQSFLKNMVPLILVVEIVAFIFLYKLYIDVSVQDKVFFDKVLYEDGTIYETPSLVTQKNIALYLFVIPWITAALIYFVSEMKKNKDEYIVPKCSIVLFLLFLPVSILALFLLILPLGFVNLLDKIFSQKLHFIFLLPKVFFIINAVPFLGLFLLLDITGTSITKGAYLGIAYMILLPYIFILSLAVSLIIYFVRKFADKDKEKE